MPQHADHGVGLAPTGHRNGTPGELNGHGGQEYR